MDYFAWADEYEGEILKISMIIDLLNEEKKRTSLTIDQKHAILQRIIAYRKIRIELRDCADTLRKRGVALNDTTA